MDNVVGKKYNSLSLLGRFFLMFSTTMPQKKWDAHPAPKTKSKASRFKLTGQQFSGT